MQKKRAFSGIQPSGIPTLGNYFGAMRNWTLMQEEYDCIMCVVNLHALTQRFAPEVLTERTRYLYALLHAVGLDPDKSTLFVQSHVPQHSQLTWILNCYTAFGEMSRMTQFKDKSKKQADNINVGLFDYPVLMASDILLYGSHVVPVGADQKQHVEISRDIAERFNGLYGDILVLPEPVIPKMGGRVMSLQDPARKMDKSDPNPAAFISLQDTPDVVLKKCKKAVTDSDSTVRFDPENKPGVSNLMSLYALCTNQTLEQVEAEFDGKGYGAFKPALAEVCNAVLAPIQERCKLILDDKAQMDAMMAQGAEKAMAIAEKTLQEVHRAVGIAL